MPASGLCRVKSSHFGNLLKVSLFEGKLALGVLVYDSSIVSLSLSSLVVSADHWQLKLLLSLQDLVDEGSLRFHFLGSFEAFVDSSWVYLVRLLLVCRVNVPLKVILL